MINVCVHEIPLDPSPLVRAWRSGISFTGTGLSCWLEMLPMALFDKAFGQLHSHLPQIVGPASGDADGFSSKRANYARKALLSESLSILYPHAPYRLAVISRDLAVAAIDHRGQSRAAPASRQCASRKP